MAWTDPSGHVWTTGEVVTAANMNTYIEANLVFLGTPPACRVNNSAAISLTTGVVTTLTFNTERYKTDAGMHSTSTNTSRLVATVAGKYAIGGGVEFASNATGNRQISIAPNGTGSYLAVENTSAVNGLGTECNINTVYALAVNDYVELTAFQSSGGALNVNSSANWSPEFYMSWVGF